MTQTSKKTRRRPGWRYFRNLFIATLISLVVVYYGFTGFLGTQEAGNWAYPRRVSLCCSPADVGLRYEKVSFKTQDGLTLRGWFLPGSNGAGIIVIHGHGTNREYVFEVSAMLARHHYSVLTFDVRAQGESDGLVLNHVELDVLAAVDYLKTRAEVRLDRIGAWGFSLGGMMVIHGAALSDAIKAVAADGTGISGIKDTLPPRTLADLLYLTYDITFYISLPIRVGRFAPSATIDAVPKIAPRPLLLIASADWQYEREYNEAFYAAAGEPKSLWLIPGILHGGGWSKYPDEYERRLTEFFDQALVKGRTQ